MAALVFRRHIKDSTESSRKYKRGGHCRPFANFQLSVCFTRLLPLWL